MVISRSLTELSASTSSLIEKRERLIPMWEDHICGSGGVGSLPCEDMNHDKRDVSKGDNEVMNIFVKYNLLQYNSHNILFP